MTPIHKLAEQMRSDWDRRVGHDYRFWMGEGHLDDHQLKVSGAADFASIAHNIAGGEHKIALEVGCGVGRMLKPASQSFGRVIGIDISRLAIDKARELIGSNAKIELVTGSGIDLSPIESASVDFVWSYAALACMPVPVIAAYLREIRRVVKASGIIRLQVYLGHELVVHEHDTLHLRSFAPENFRRAVSLAGLESVDVTERELSEQEEGQALGIKDCLVTIKPSVRLSADVQEIACALLPRGESTQVSEADPKALEAWMALNYAETLADTGESRKARELVEYVVANCNTTTIDTRDILDRILQKTSQNPTAVVSIDDGSFYLANLDALKERFPKVFEALQLNEAVETAHISVRGTRDGASLWSGTTCLDHAEKPIAAAQSWVGRTLHEERCAQAKHLVVAGFGGGYHLEALLRTEGVLVSCFEPDVGVFRKAMQVRDLRSILNRLEKLFVGDDINQADVPAGAELLVRPQTNILNSRSVEKIRSILYSKRGCVELHPKIAVLGPLHGGTLPTTSYTANALMRMGQRVRAVDVSGFNDGFMLFDKFIGQEPRRAGLRRQYIDVVSSTLLESFEEKPCDILICMAQAPISGKALTELRSKGVITVLWFVEDYLRFSYWREMAKFYDFVFTIQKGECIDKIRAAGAGEVHYVPTACDPYFHCPRVLTDEQRKKWGSPISFVGAGYHNRQQMFAGLSHLPFKIWGSEWPTGKPFDRLVQEDSRRVTPDEYVNIFNATEINLNLHSSSERDGVDPSGDFVNPRTFELAACGAFQLCDSRALLPELLEPGKEIITFNNRTELREQIEYYRAHPEERQVICERARERVLRDHTYERRLEQMLSIIYASKYETLRQRENKSPWTEMIKRAEKYPELLERCQRAQARGEEPALDGLIADIMTGKGKLTETEQKLLFMYHVRSQIIRMQREEAGLKQ